MFGLVFKVFHGTIITPVVKKSLAGTNVQFREDCAKHFAGSPNSSINTVTFVDEVSNVKFEVSNVKLEYDD